MYLKGESMYKFFKNNGLLYFIFLVWIVFAPERWTYTHGILAGMLIALCFKLIFEILDRWFEPDG